MKARPSHQPRLSDLPSCTACSDLLVAPEASVLSPEGDVRYLWTCDSCGESLITSTRSANLERAGALAA